MTQYMVENEVSKALVGGSKVKKIPLVTIVLILMASVGHCEIIYTKDGNTVNCKIVNVAKGTIWYETSSGKVGIPKDSVLEIQNDDGTISAYSPTYKEAKNSTIEENQQKFPEEQSSTTEAKQESDREESQIGSESSNKDLYDAKLTRFLTLAISSTASEKEKGLAAEELIKFSSDYPNSEFASDAQMLPNVMTCLGASSEGSKETALFYEKIVAIANKYPEGKFSELTCRKWRDFFGKQSSGLIFIPYKYLPAYAQGVLALDARQFQSTVDNLSVLKSNLDFSKDTSGVLASEIYVPLLLSYKYLGKMEEFNTIAKEASEKFPDNIELIQTVKRLTAKYTK